MEDLLEFLDLKIDSMREIRVRVLARVEQTTGKPFDLNKARSQMFALDDIASVLDAFDRAEHADGVRQAKLLLDALLNTDSAIPPDRTA